MQKPSKEQLKYMKIIEKEENRKTNSILKLLKVNLVKKTYKEKDIIQKLKSKDFPLERIKIKIYELKKYGEIYETNNGYLIPLLNTPLQVRKALSENTNYYDPKLKEHILRLIKKRKEPITEKEVLILSEMEGFREDEIKIVLYELFRDGDIYKPRKGYLKATDSAPFR